MEFYIINGNEYNLPRAGLKGYLYSPPGVKPFRSIGIGRVLKLKKVMMPALQNLGPLPCLCDAFSPNGETLLLPDVTSGLYLGVTNFAVVSQSNTALRFDNYNWLKLRTFV